MKDRAMLDAGYSILDENQGSRIEGRENYFCESYRQFFDYTIPRFMQIAAAIEDGSAARHTRSADRIRLRIQK